MNIIQNLVPESKYAIKCPYEMNAEFIVVHNTDNDASARNEIAYMISNDKEISYHYAVDDKEIIQGLLETRNGWHSGDGENGAGNRKGIGIEICYSECGGERFLAAEKLAAKFIAHKLKEKGWGIDKVKKHQDFSGKYCPRRTMDLGWQRFLNMIQIEMNDNKLYKVILEGLSKDKAESVANICKGTSVTAMIEEIPQKVEVAPAVNDIVYFKGGTQYNNPVATNGEYRPAGQAKITKISEGTQHPYHLIKTGDVGPYGWVDADTFTKE